MENKQHLEKDFAQMIDRLDQDVPVLFRNFAAYLFPNSKDGLTHVQTVMLKLLYYEGSQTVSEIADFMGVTMAAVSSLTDRLLKNKLITRERSEKDRRVVIISLTAEGRELIQLFLQERRRKLQRLLEELGWEKSEQLLAVVADLRAALEKLQGAAGLK
ncbi:MAG: MarR family transcriptional regulator [Bacillota bacterium]|uniref:MarR family transcriptional regulator n=1 Tax=Desulfurispora thermophila TaxID=265470 RepID=UPI0003AA3620|nr:MarR family transcriptional regulator [Desulfurispora thermophila]